MLAHPELAGAEEVFPGQRAERRPPVRRVRPWRANSSRRAGGRRSACELASFASSFRNHSQDGFNFSRPSRSVVGQPPPAAIVRQPPRLPALLRARRPQDYRRRGRRRHYGAATPGLRKYPDIFHPAFLCRRFGSGWARLGFRFSDLAPPPLPAPFSLALHTALFYTLSRNHECRTL